MANTDNPCGFKPLDNKPLRVTAYRIQGSEGTAYSENLFIGDMVTLSSGYIVVGTAGTGNHLLGAIVGFECITSGLAAGGYYPDDSSDDWYALVADDPEQRFVAQCDGGGTLAQANVGETVNLKTTHSGNTTTNLSGQEIDSSATAGAVTDQFRLLGLVDKPGNAWGANGEYIVVVHDHTLNQPVA